MRTRSQTPPPWTNPCDVAAADSRANGHVDSGGRPVLWIAVTPVSEGAQLGPRWMAGPGGQGGKTSAAAAGWDMGGRRGHDFVGWATVCLAILPSPRRPSRAGGEVQLPTTWAHSAPLASARLRCHLDGCAPPAGSCAPAALPHQCRYSN